MYMDRVIEIGRAANGFVVCCKVPLKPEAKKNSTLNSCCCPESSKDKEYVAKTSQEVSKLIDELMPLLDMDYKTEDEFDKAFEAATGEDKED